MANRDDSVLYTGMTSRTAQVVNEERKKMKAEKELKKSTVLPVGDIIIEEIDKQINSLNRELANLIEADTTPEDVKSILLSIRMTNNKLVEMKTVFTNILRTQDDGKEQ